MRNRLLIIFLFFCGAFQVYAHDFIGNPVVPGYLSDPCLVFYEDKYYLFGTINPSGNNQISLWESKDFVNWTYHGLNCPLPSPSDGLFKSPSVIQGGNGKFFLFVTYANDIYVYVSEHPLGPWDNPLKNSRALINSNPEEETELRDASPFIDDNGHTFLYWSASTIANYKKCYVTQLKKNMKRTLGNPVEITPEKYYGSPDVFKHKGQYYLFYSSGNPTDSSYKVKYVLLDHPLKRSSIYKEKTILSSIDNNKNIANTDIIGPGNSFIFKAHHQNIIIYDRIYTKRTDEIYRQTCADEIRIIEKDKNAVVEASNLGIAVFEPEEREGERNLATWTLVSSSSNLSNEISVFNSVDHRYGTKWAASETDTAPAITIDIREEKMIHEIILFPEYQDKPYKFIIEYSTDKKSWHLFSSQMENPLCGSPFIIKNQVRGRYFKIVFHKMKETPSPGIWEIGIYQNRNKL